MPDITVSLTSTQQKCFDYITSNTTDWVSNVATERARLAQNDIIERLVAHCNANDISLAVGADAQVSQAFELGVVTTAAAAEAASETPD